MLIAAGVFGIMKFRDVFSSSNNAREPIEATEQTEDTAADESDTPAQEDKDTEADEQTHPSPAPTAASPADSVGTLSWVVNKRRPLNPKTYIPPNLVTPNVKNRAGATVRSDVAAALEQLFAAAQAAGHDPMLSSGYRSYNTQVSVYNSYVSQDGQVAADTYSARPGYSEHQTGLAADVCNASNCELEESFGDTPFGQWLAANAATYGFTIRYKQGKSQVTGYTYEPWHLRYVGLDIAAKLGNQTLEEYFSLPAAPDYL